MEKKELVKQEVESTVTPIELLGRSVEEAEKKLALVQKIKALALKVTNKNDWVDLGGKPYLMASGAEKIARLFGISWRIEEPTKEILEDGHIVYTYKGIFTMGTVEIEAIGTCSTKDPFFARRKDDQGNVITLPVQDVPIGDVKKAAYTNCIMNGITRLLGLRNLTWEDLEKHGVIQKKEVTSVEYAETIEKFFKVKEIEIKSGVKSDGTSYEMFVVIAYDEEEGQEYKMRTFSKTLGKLLEEAQAEATTVLISAKKGKYGWEIISAEKILF